MNRYPLVLVLLFVGCAAKPEDKPQGSAPSKAKEIAEPLHPKVDVAPKKLDLVRKYRLFESDQQRSTTADAIVLVNRILGDDISFRLHPSWAPSDKPGRESVDVYLIEVDPIGKYGPSFVPKGDRCVFVDAGQAAAISDVFSKKYTGAIKVKSEQLLAIALLHEAGHLFHGHWGGLEEGNEVGDKSNLSVEETVEKKREYEADRFAAAQIKAGMVVGSDALRFSASIKLAATLTTVSANLTFQRLIDNFGATTLESPKAFWDERNSHPNFEYRILKINYEINPSNENQQLIDGFEKARKQATPKKKLFEKK
jgi:hypothetical protein